jgi:hypothetical protein
MNDEELLKEALDLLIELDDNGDTRYFGSAIEIDFCSHLYGDRWGEKSLDLIKRISQHLKLPEYITEM